MVGFMKSALNFLGIGDKKGAAVELDAFLSDLPSQLGFNVTIDRVEKGDDAIYFDVNGEEADVLVGKNAEVLDALAHLSMKILRRKADAEGTSSEDKEQGSNGGAPFFRVVFDSNGFRDKRVEELKSMARELREKVIEAGGKPAYVPALSPAERKVIHTTLAELGDVMTESLGDGTFKRIRIRLPSDSPHRKPQENTGNAAGGGEKRFGNRNGGGGGRGPRRGGNNGGGGNRNFRGGRPNPNRQKNNDFNFGDDSAVNGNVFTPESDMPHIDDNIGNRASSSEDNYNK